MASTRDKDPRQPLASVIERVIVHPATKHLPRPHAEVVMFAALPMILLELLAWRVATAVRRALRRR
jgi:hypothetical protein